MEGVIVAALLTMMAAARGATGLAHALGNAFEIDAFDDLAGARWKLHVTRDDMAGEAWLLGVSTGRVMADQTVDVLL